MELAAEKDLLLQVSNNLPSPELLYSNVTYKYSCWNFWVTLFKLFKKIL